MAKAKVVVTATDDLAKGLNNSKKQLNDFEKYIVGVGGKIQKAFSIAALSAATVAAFKAMGAAAKQCVQEFSEAEKVSKRLEAVWANVGSATGKSTKQIDDYAESIEKVTYFSAESVKESALLLAATESLTEDGFQRALDVSVDLAAALGEDVSSAASTLAKALVAPDEAFRSLKQVGVAFTDAEKEQIKALIEAGQEYEAQALILDRIEQKYKGVAKAINATPAGTLDNIKDTLSDIRKNLGGSLLDAISPALDFLLKKLQAISQWVADSRGVTSILSAIQAGEDIGNVSDEMLQRAREQAWKNIFMTSGAEAEMQSATGRSIWDDVVDIIDAEISRRANNPAGSSDMYSAWEIAGEEIGEAVSEAVAEAVEDPLAAFLKSYGKDSADYQIQAYNEIISLAEGFITQLSDERRGLLSHGTFGTDEFNKNYATALELTDTITILQQIIESTRGKIAGLSPTESERFIAKSGLIEKDSIYVEPTEAELQRDAFNEALPGTLTSNLGEFGSVVAEATSNISQMGVGLGTLMTVIKPIIQGINQVVGPMLDAITTSVLEPLLEVGKAVGSLLLPVLTLLTPVLEVLGEGIIVVASVFQWVGQLLSHWAAAFVNSFSWITGFSMRDPGNPGNILDYIQGNLENYRSDVGGATYGTGSVGTDTAISSASYRGATSVTINIYAEGPIVGDGGMREFARMIRDEFDALDYYGVTA